MSSECDRKGFDFLPGKFIQGEGDNLFHYLRMPTGINARNCVEMDGYRFTTLCFEPSDDGWVLLHAVVPF